MKCSECGSKNLHTRRQKYFDYIKRQWSKRVVECIKCGHSEIRVIE